MKFNKMNSPTSVSITSVSILMGIALLCSPQTWASWETEILKKGEAARAAALVKVSREGDLEKIKFLLENGVNPNQPDKNEKLALLEAARHQQWGAVYSLLGEKSRSSLKADPELTDKPEYLSLLDLAIRFENLELVDTLLTEGVHLSPSALSSAIRTKNVGMVSRLLEQPKLNVNDEVNGSTPLTEALDTRDLEILNALLTDPRLDINRVDPKTGITIAHRLARAASNYSKVFDLVLQKTKLNLNVVDKADYSPLYYAATKSPEILARVLAAGGNPDFHDDDSPLREAVTKEYYFNANLLLAAGANPDFLFQEPLYKNRLPLLTHLANYRDSFRKHPLPERSESLTLEAAKLYLRAKLGVSPYDPEREPKAYQKMVKFLEQYETQIRPWLEEYFKDTKEYPAFIYFKAGTYPDVSEIPFPIEFYKESKDKPAQLILHVKGPRDLSEKLVKQPEFIGGFKNAHLSWDYNNACPYVLLNSKNKTKGEQLKQEFLGHLAFKDKGATDPGHLLEYVGKKQQPKVAIVQKFLGKDLYLRKKEIHNKEKYFYDIFVPVMEALAAILKEGLSHGDVKLGNILIQEGGLGGLSDFGGLVKLKETVKAFTYDYLPPEFHRSGLTPYQYPSDAGLDVFALGKAMLNYIYPTEPFLIPGAPVQERYARLAEVRKLKDYEKYGIYCTQRGQHPLEKLICQMIHPDPAKRISATEAYQLITEIREKKAGGAFEFSKFFQKRPSMAPGCEQSQGLQEIRDIKNYLEGAQIKGNGQDPGKR